MQTKQRRFEVFVDPGSDIRDGMFVSISHEDLLPIAEEVLGKGGGLRFRAAGTSMSPFIRSGDKVVISPIEGPIETGDILLLKKDRKLILHRVVARGCDGLITRGDACTSVEGPVLRDDILGKVTEVSGKGYNFHLKYPFKYLIAKRIILPRKLFSYRLVLRVGKRLISLAS